MNAREILTTHILPNISRSKGNQTMKFSQLIECNIINNFLEKSYTKWGGETSPRPISESSKLSISLDQQLEILCSLFLIYVQVENYQNILKLRYRPFVFTSCKSFLIKKRSGTSTRPSTYTWFFKINIFHVILY